MKTFSVLLALCEGNPPVTSGFPSQRPVMQSCDVFFDLCLNKQLSKQSRCQWFDMPLRSLWRHCDDMIPKAYSGLLHLLAHRPLAGVAANSKSNFQTYFSNWYNEQVQLNLTHVNATGIHLWWERERERLSLSAFLRTEDIGVHIVHISRLIITYTLE